MFDVVTLVLGILLAIVVRGVLVRRRIFAGRADQNLAREERSTRVRARSSAVRLRSSTKSVMAQRTRYPCLRTTCAFGEEPPREPPQVCSAAYPPSEQLAAGSTQPSGSPTRSTPHSGNGAGGGAPPRN